MTTNRTARLGVAAAALLCVAGVTFLGCSEKGGAGGEWPVLPIQISCFASAGGDTDLVNRTIAKAIEPHLGGLRVDVVNRTGGQGGVALNYVWSQPHEGYHWGGFSESILPASVMGGHHTSAKDWTYFIVAGAPGVISVGADSPYKTLGELVAAAKAEPKKISAAASVTGGCWHTKLMALEKAAGVSFNFIPHKGSNPSQLAVLTGEVAVVLTSISEQAELIRDGKLVPLAMVEEDPYEFPGRGTIPAAAASYPDVSKVPVCQWLGFALPKDTPPAVLARITSAFEKAVQSKEIKDMAATRMLNLRGLHGDKANELALSMERAWTWMLFDMGIAKKSPEEFGISRN